MDLSNQTMPTGDLKAAMEKLLQKDEQAVNKSWGFDDGDEGDTTDGTTQHLNQISVNPGDSDSNTNNAKLSSNARDWGFDDSDEEETASSPGRNSVYPHKSDALRAKPSEGADWGFDDSDGEQTADSNPRKVATSEKSGDDNRELSDDDDSVYTYEPSDMGESTELNGKPSNNDNDWMSEDESGSSGSDSSNSRSKYIQSILEAIEKEREGKSKIPLLRTPLGSAVGALDVDLVRQRLPDHDVKILDYSDNTLIHLVADPQLNDDAASRFTSWEELLEATRGVVRLLVDSGLDIDAVNKSGDTPLLSTIGRFKGGYYKNVYPHEEPRGNDRWGEGHVIIALLEVGANIDRLASVRSDVCDQIWEERGRGSSSDDEELEIKEVSTLDLWITVDSSKIRFPEKYDDVLRTLFSKMPNPNVRREGKTVLHRLVESELSVDRKCHLIRTLLESETTRPLNIDSLDDTGKTPFLHALRTARATASEMIQLADFFLELGARPEIVSARGATAISGVYLNVFLEPDSKRCEVIEHLIKSTPSLGDSTNGNNKLVMVTPIWILASALYTGDIATARLLLKLGMKHRLHEAVNFPANSSGSKVPLSRELKVLRRQRATLTVFDIAFYSLTMENNAWEEFLRKYDDSLKSVTNSYDEDIDEDEEDETDNETWSCKSSTHAACQCNKNADEGDGSSQGEWETDGETEDTDGDDEPGDIYIPLTFDDDDEEIASTDDKVDDGFASLKDIINHVTGTEDKDITTIEKRIRPDERLGVMNLAAGILFGVHRDFWASFCKHYKIPDDDFSLLLKEDVIHVPTELLMSLKTIFQN
ncbi:hypothetical protein TWF696_005470 [Orbilia brochopaga]|uniref:Uncharacterized protein n=1 Tax=Orbilia brochopaga TaxID=3140254 RepID=A0AAV9V3K5_9PEZI